MTIASVLSAVSPTLPNLPTAPSLIADTLCNRKARVWPKVPKLSWEFADSPASQNSSESHLLRCLYRTFVHLRVHRGDNSLQLKEVTPSTMKPRHSRLNRDPYEIAAMARIVIHLLHCAQLYDIYVRHMS
ncbi:hypothetical protein VOLCADRAFT_108253 [Volvox carteri f. nagariensis]|uniref:Uncharacterized protein n=1 Tax=Volvox carteri f. nagariensis TaxID=3068 RepID=D8UJ50_VOLCA|nr:uncharacterized protein VOLCADRAFT_108253 [Volvox carteri f. nagariensis]EFJ40252.1 hypothetical protein VOLCADRAFT_108253 [Volvox carteri f. nagariensis]|eukprot:XP_002958692.1 hypothetical protein VOLCADRAFT_108253 [Volvox carteri f. nagariensis]